MNLDLTKLISGLQDQMVFDFELELDKSFMESIGSVDASVIRVSGVVKKLEKRYVLTFTYSGEATFECHRCLQPVTITLENSAERLLVPTRDFDEEEDWVELVGRDLMLVPILEEDITLNLPLQVLCTETCNGLCPQCGIDLNKETCVCNESKIDPRLEALKHLFT
ncbi:YceD family protein [Fusibacter sp. JL298sf-3]